MPDLAVLYNPNVSMPQERAVTATVLTKNSENKIGNCLSALKSFPEVVVLDNGSTDKTLEIAAKFENVKVFRSEFIGFGALKNLAAAHASNNWIFSVDSDETVTEKLAESILTHRLNPDEIGTVHRRNHYRGRRIDACGWQNDISKRLYNRKHVTFSDSLVHESLAGSNRTIRLRGDLNHFPFDNASQLLDKAQFYSSLYAAENRFRRRSSIFKAAARSVTTFVRDYIFKYGFLYGQDGLFISGANATGAFYKYAKLYEANKNLSVSLIVTTYNRPDALELVLLSLKEQTELPDEVIIADDGSGQETRELLERYKPDFPVPIVHCWQRDEGFRLAQIRNKAAAAAGCEYMIVVDGDMLLHRDFVKGHKRAAWKGRYVQGSRVWFSEDDAESVIKSGDINSLPSFQKKENWLRSINSPFLSKLFSRVTRQLEGVKGCNMAFWKEDCIKVNGFNEDFKSWGREDSEFVARLMNSGVQRLNLRFAGIAYHLSHTEVPRPQIASNDKLLQRTISEKLKYCENGIVKERSSVLGL